MRGLAVSTCKRFPTAPDLPSVAEAGVPGFDVSAWIGFFVPAKTPPEIVAKMHADTAAMLAEPAIKAKLEQVGVLVVGLDAPSLPSWSGRRWRPSCGKPGSAS